MVDQTKRREALGKAYDTMCDSEEAGEARRDMQISQDDPYGHRRDPYQDDLYKDERPKGRTGKPGGPQFG